MEIAWTVPGRGGMSSEARRDLGGSCDLGRGLGVPYLP